MAVPEQTAAAEQVSLDVQRLLSSQATPVPLVGFEHMPVAGAHAPALWHESRAMHMTGLPAQAPAVQVSTVVQLLASLHAVPVGAFGVVHTPVATVQVPGT